MWTSTSKVNTVQRSPKEKNPIGFGFPKSITTSRLGWGDFAKMLRIAGGWQAV
jgi:hypothetical protein